MGHQIYAKGHFVIIQFSKGKSKEFMVINQKKKNKYGFKYAHTHLKSFYICKRVIHLVQKGKIDQSLNLYALTSLYRIAENERYREKVNNLIATKKNKGKQVYRNKPVM